MMKRISIILLILLTAQIFTATNARQFLIIKKKIFKHYKTFALYTENEEFTHSKIKIFKLRKRFLRNIFLLIDKNRIEEKKMLYGYSDNFLYPIHNLSTYNDYMRTIPIFLTRRNIMAYFKNFLLLQKYYSRNFTFVNIDKEKLIEKYGKYGKEGFKKRMENYFLDEPEIKFLRNEAAYKVSLPTFTVIQDGHYFRLRITHGEIHESGIIRKIWGEKSQYFIYNGSKAPLSRWRISRFESTIY